MNIESKYFATSDVNEFTSEILIEKIIENELVDESHISEFADNSNLATLGIRGEWKAEQDKIVKLQTFDSSCFCGKSLLKIMECKII